MSDSLRMDASSRSSIAMLLVGSAAFVAIALALVPIPMLYFYDDGVYFQTGIRLAEGDRPFTDFYLAHPPALPWLAAISHTLGIGIIGCRLMSFAIGIGFLFGLAAFVGRLSGEGRSGPIGALAAFFLASTTLYVDAMSQVLTQLPAMALTLAGFFFLSSASPRPLIAGLLLAIASTFRIQVAFIAPAWVCYLLVAQGWSAGWKSVILLTVGTVVPAAIIHGGLVAMYPNYLDCVHRSHLTRPSSSIGEKMQVLTDLFREPQVPIGLLAAVVLSFTGGGLVRALAIFTLVEVGLTFFGSRFLFDSYLFPCYPYLFACAAILVGREAGRVRASWPIYALTTAMILMCCGIPMGRVAVYRMTRLKSFERDLITRVGAAPGDVVLCTPAKIPLFAGKSMVKDYFTPDTTSPLTRDFGEWFVSNAKRADIVVLTDVAVRDLSPANCQDLLRMGKAIVYATPEDEAEFRRRAGVN